jgi:antitoxin component of MazEF toxin-antitoxin module
MMKAKSGMRFNEHLIDGWKCVCGEVYYRAEQAERILLLNKLRKDALRATLGKIKSNLILRVPKDVEHALGLRQGEEVEIRIEGDGMKIVPVQLRKTREMTMKQAMSNLSVQ